MSADSKELTYDDGYADGYADGVRTVLNTTKAAITEVLAVANELGDVFRALGIDVESVGKNADVPSHL